MCRKLPLQYALRQICLYFLQRRNFQGADVIQADHVPAKGGFYRLLSKLAFVQLVQGFREGLNIVCRWAPVEFAPLALAPRVQ